MGRKRKSDEPSEESGGNKRPSKEDCCKKRMPISNNKSSKNNTDVTTDKLLRQTNSTYLKYNYGLGVQCDACQKWRHCKEYDGVTKLAPDYWVCSMAQNDGTKIDCTTPSVLTEADFAEEKYVPPMLVWARYRNKGWWPAMIEDDPDMQIYYDKNGNDYHVVYLTETPSRGWIKDKQLRAYTEDYNPNIELKGRRDRFNLNKKDKMNLEKAVENIRKAHKMSPKERFQNFSFANAKEIKFAKADSDIEEDTKILPGDEIAPIPGAEIATIANPAINNKVKKERLQPVPPLPSNFTSGVQANNWRRLVADEPMNSEKELVTEIITEMMEKVIADSTQHKDEGEDDPEELTDHNDESSHNTEPKEPMSKQEIDSNAGSEGRNEEKSMESQLELEDETSDEETTTFPPVIIPPEIKNIPVEDLFGDVESGDDEVERAYVDIEAHVRMEILLEEWRLDTYDS